MRQDKVRPPFQIGSSEVHVWFFKLDLPGQVYPAWERSLAENEIDRSKSYKFVQDRLRFIARRGILRQLLGRYCGLDPAEIDCRVNPYGKLSLISQPLSFSLAHSEDRVAFAFTLEREVGVDIERILPLPDLSQLVESWFSPEERADLFVLAPEARLEAFYHTWTQKEAYLKAHGEGLSLPLKDFSVSVDPAQPGRFLSVRGAAGEIPPWRIASHVPEAGWRSAVCVHAEVNINFSWYLGDLADFI